MMQIMLNGEARKVKEGTSLSALLEEMGMPTIGIAVERNREIVPKSEHRSTLLMEGDRLEIVRMVGGG